MDALDFLGHVWYLILIIGQLLIIKRRRIGFLVRFAGELGWGWIGLKLGMSSIVIWSVIFAIVELTGWIRWGRSDHDREIREVDGNPR